VTPPASIFRDFADYFLPVCPPSAETIWAALKALLSGHAPKLPYPLLKYE
jgi:NAD-reducing hydrogenase small subunit